MALTADAPVAIVRTVPQRPTDEKFLRAAIKAGLRMQRDESSEAAGGSKRGGVATLVRIKSSLRKRNSHPGTNL